MIDKIQKAKKDRMNLPNILLVEDNETDVKIILRAFEKANLSCNVIDMPDGETALRYLNQMEKGYGHKGYPKIDLIILDLLLPKMNGVEFVQCLRSLQICEDIPVFVFSKKEKFDKKFHMEGVNECFNKTIDGHDLIARIKTYLKI